MKAKDIIQMIEGAGWRLDRTAGSHYIYKHPKRVGTVVVPVHGLNRDLAPGTALAILKAAGLR